MDCGGTAGNRTTQIIRLNVRNKHHNSVNHKYTVFFYLPSGVCSRCYTDRGVYRGPSSCYHLGKVAEQIGKLDTGSLLLLSASLSHGFLLSYLYGTRPYDTYLCFVLFIVRPHHIIRSLCSNTGDKQRRATRQSAVALLIWRALWTQTPIRQQWETTVSVYECMWMTT